MSLFTDGHLPDLYLIPSTAWRTPSALLVDRNYEGLQSAPEWGINISKRNQTLLDAYKFDTVIQQLLQ